MEKNITFKFTEKNFTNPNQMQALTLAYIGDSIYDIMSREYVMKNHLGKINDLHKTVSTIVSARAQASFMENILNNRILTEQEEKLLSILKIGRENIKTTKELLKEMQFENTNRGMRCLRELVRRLRLKYKVPILSMRKRNANGYFIAETTNEIVEYIAPISSQIKQEKRILSVLKTSSLEKWKDLLRGA